MYFEDNSKQKQSSIKISQIPGGNSNFQFHYDDPETKVNAPFKKLNDTRASYDIINLESKENSSMNFENQKKVCSKRMNYDYGKEQYNMFHNQYPEEGKHSSIKVTQMPGGNSHVCYAPQQ